MKTDDELFVPCVAAVRSVDPGATVEPVYRTDDPKLIAGARVTLAPGATDETRKQAHRAFYTVAQARWAITFAGDSLPS